jgi:hypothetical protein
LQWRQTLDKFWGTTMLVLFIFYPAVSIAALRAFNCDPNLGLLKDDYTVICPPMTSFLALYSAVFVVLYPFGIPFFMIQAMKFMKVKKIVKDKMDTAKVSAMLSLFMKRACSVECFRIARLVGNVDNSPADFDRETKREFDKLLAIQGDVGEEEEADVLVIEILKQREDSKTQDHGMEGITVKELCDFFEQFDANGDGNRASCYLARVRLC